MSNCPDDFDANDEIVRLTELSEMLAKQLWEQVSRNLKLVEYWKKQQKEKERLETELFNLKQKLDRLTIEESANNGH